MSPDMFDPQAIDLILELERELKVRERLYPKWIESKKINEKTAAWRILCIQRAISYIKERSTQT